MLANIGSPEISFMFFLGVLFMPRLMMLWLGAIAPGSVQAILGFSFAPRIMICSMLSAASSDTSGGLVVLWIFAIVIDIIGFIIKSKLAITIWKAQQEAYQEAKYNMNQIRQERY